MATPYRDGPIYDLRCGGGHKAQVLLGNPKHEILFQMGAYSLLDGVYRDVVSTIGSSLEEFWEFSLQCILASQNVQPLPVPRVRHGRKERFEKHWSAALETKPPVLMSEDYEIRNRVMHEAYFPTEEEAVEFGDEVLVTIVRRCRPFGGNCKVP